MKKQNRIEKLAEKYASENSIYDTAWDDTYHGFIGGFFAAEKEFKKKLKDKYNHLNSELKQLCTPKLGKIVNEEKVAELKAKLELLKDLIK